MSPDRVKEYIQAIIDSVTPLANKVGVASEQLFGWALKHNYAIAAIDLLPILFLIPSVWLLVFFSRKAKWIDGGRYDLLPQRANNAAAWWQVGFLITTTILLIWTVGGIGSAIPRLIAPEYSTMIDIIHMVRGPQ